MNKKVLIIGLGKQGLQYVDYFQKNNYTVTGVCNSKATQSRVESEKSIHVYTDISTLHFLDYSVIVLALPSEIQGNIALEILQTGFSEKLIIETPISWDYTIISELKKYKNVIFFLEEYYTLLSQMLRRIDIGKIENIDIDIYISKGDYDDKKSREVTYMHIRNNFLGIGDIHKNYNIIFHESEKIYYEMSFNYMGKDIRYVFKNEKYLRIGSKKYIDIFHFDAILRLLLQEKRNINKYYELRI